MRTLISLLTSLLVLAGSQAFANETVKTYFKESNKVIDGLHSQGSAKKKIDDLNSSVQDLEAMIESVYYDLSVPEQTVTVMMNIKNMIRTAGEIEVRGEQIDRSSCQRVLSQMRFSGMTAEGYSDVAMSTQEKELISAISSLCKN